MTATKPQLPEPLTRPPADDDTAQTQSPDTSPARCFAIRAGRPHPLGATLEPDGVNFSVFAGEGAQASLLLFERPDSPEPMQEFILDPEVHQSFRIWHVFVEGIGAGAHYGFRISGAGDLHGRGGRFDPGKLLLDPYARGVTKRVWQRGPACMPGDNVATSMRSTVIDLDGYDWEGDQPLNRPMHESVIYEMHVGGFTRSPTSGVQAPGTYRAVIDKIPYLASLGVTAVELLPVFLFDEGELDRTLPDGSRLTNYWGYSPIALFAPHDGYGVDPAAGSHVTEFRDMVKALHRAGIEVILDVVFNHTGEGNHLGPMINLKGFANEVYYHLEPNDRQYYSDYSGCGNTLNCNHPVTEKLIVECLLYWVKQMHVDGFRFDEGSILSRDMDGAPTAFAPVPWSIELTDDLAGTKVIAEAWDAAGLYQVGYFPGYRWAQWNDRFRDDVRRFVRGDPGITAAVATRIAGSSDIYQPLGRQPINGINFVSAHDGFTMNDLVSYNGKHNGANGEDNRDGNDNNLSWNCGAEGETDDAAVEQLRERQIRNLATILFVSQGVPMFVAGDEVRRSQQGNNNAYCHDDELSWFDWTLPDKNGDMLRFFSELIARRKTNWALHRPRFFDGAINERGLPDLSWHGCALGQPGFDDPASSALAFTLGAAGEDMDLHVMMNMAGDALGFELPALDERIWFRVVDTAVPAPRDILGAGTEIPITDGQYLVSAHSVVVLASGPASDGP